MSYLIRVLLPDTPGSLGKLAEAFGEVGGNIESVDVVEGFNDGTVMDDIVVTLPSTSLPDTLITAAQQIAGVEVDSIRPFSGRVDRRGQIEMLTRVAANKRDEAKAMQELVDVIPLSMTSGWSIVLRANQNSSTRIAGSGAAPEDDGSSPVLDVTTARVLNPEVDKWVPESWALLDASLAATPLGKTDLVLVVGRPGGPDFLASEVELIGSLGNIVGAILK